MNQRAIGDGTVIDVGVEVDPRDAQIETLRAENRRLQRALSDAEVRAERAREDADRALVNLRRQLGPLYRALQMVFGELDSAGVREVEPSPVMPTRESGTGADQRILNLWNEWKQNVSPSAARVIDALLTHGELSVDQICVAAKMGRNTVYDVLKQLKKPGLLVKNGGRVSLKQL